MSVRKLGGRLAAAVGVITLALVGGAATPAAACACGAYITNGDTRSAASEPRSSGTARPQDLVVSLDVLGATPDAGFLMPVPAQAEITLEDAALFDELADRTKPREEQVTNWWPNLTFLEKLGLRRGRRRAPAGAAPDRRPGGARARSAHGRPARRERPGRARRPGSPPTATRSTRASAPPPRRTPRRAGSWSR